jgi:hypothetical protein
VAGVVTRYQRWFTALWADRIGLDAAQMNCETQKWNLAQVGCSLVLIIIAGVGWLAPTDWLFLPGIAALSVFLISRWRAGKDRVPIQEMAAGFLGYSGDVKVIPLSDVSKFDRWAKTNVAR